MKVHTKKYDMLGGSRKTLVERVGDGSIIARSDGPPAPKGPDDVVCPRFLELKWATGCPYSCAWCYLQGNLRFLDYGKDPHPQLFSKIEAHVQSFFDEDGIRPEILNSGELTDSMITEGETKPFSRFIMDLFGSQKTHKILFVTKSPEVDHLLDCGSRDRAIVSFSINSEPVARRWENAPPVEERIDAASRLQDAGFDVRLRIDPMVPFKDWRQSYSELLENVFTNLTPSRITLGSLRGSQSTINKAVDRSWAEYLEEKSDWGKKIPTTLRGEMYSAIITDLKDNYSYEKVALCKETLGIWRELKMDHRRIMCNCVR